MSITKGIASTPLAMLYSVGCRVTASHARKGAVLSSSLCAWAVFMGIWWCVIYDTQAERGGRRGRGAQSEIVMQMRRFVLWGTKAINSEPRVPRSCCPLPPLATTGCMWQVACCRLPMASCRKLTDRQSKGGGGRGAGKLIAANYKQQPQAMPQDAAAAAGISADHTCCVA